MDGGDGLWERAGLAGHLEEFIGTEVYLEVESSIRPEYMRYIVETAISL